MFKDLTNILEKKTAFKYVLFAIFWTLIIMALYSAFAPWASKAFSDGENIYYSLVISAFLPGVWLYLGLKAVIYAIRELQGKKTKVMFTILAGLMALGLVLVAVYQAIMALFAAGIFVAF